MSGYVVNIEEETIKNTNFRTVLFTTNKSQLVVMSLQPNEDIGEEVHENVDQFIRIEEGNGKVVLDGEEQTVGKNFAIVIPAGTRHNVINTSASDFLKLYTIYTPPEHRDGTIHATKEEAINDKEDHFMA